MSEIIVKELGEDRYEVRGFLLIEGEVKVLYPEPKFSSCCSEKDLKRGFYLKGKVPEGEGKCLTLKGRFEGASFVVEEGEGGSFELWLAIVLLVGLWQGYRLIKEKGSHLLKRGSVS